MQRIIVRAMATLDVLQGQIVSVSAQGGGTDAGIRCAPDGFERLWLNPVGWMRRAPL